jgi:hypothetical protein
MRMRMRMYVSSTPRFYPIGWNAVVLRTRVLGRTFNSPGDLEVQVEADTTSPRSSDPVRVFGIV